MGRIPKYQAVKDYILAKIKSGEYLPGQKLPSESEILNLLAVSSITVRKGMTELANEDIIYRVRGKGSFVKEHPRVENSSSEKLVAFLLSCEDMNDSSYIRIMIGMRRYLSQTGYSLIIENPGEDPDKEHQIISRLLDNNVAGFIIFSANPERSVGNYEYLRKKNVAFVTMDRCAKYFPTNSIVCNNHDGAFSAVEYLIGLKHRKIGFVAHNFYLSSEKERFEGYCDAMRFASLNVDNDILFTESPVDYTRLVDAIRSRQITALFAVNDHRGLELINALSERGIQIPEDVSIMGFDDYEASKLARVPLSTVRQHFEEEGYYAAKMLLTTMHNPQLQFNKILIGGQLIIRRSTAVLEDK